MHPVADRIAGGKDEHGHRMSAKAQAPQHFEAIDARKTDVEHHQVERSFGDPREGSFARGKVLNLVALQTEGARKAISQAAVIFDNQ